MNLFTSLGLPESLANTVSNLGYQEPTPVQRESIPELLKGKDVLAAAQTGTGKTAAFALPLITKLLTKNEPRKPKSTKALILAPTRELAAQIEENIRQYAKGTGISSTVIFGGVGLAPQKDILAKGVDILVATPGRLLDHIGQGNVTLKHIHTLVLDEADRMLDMGFIHDIRKVLALAPKDRQTLLFSATFSTEIMQLAKDLLKEPVVIEIEKNKDVALITQEAYLINKKRKRELVRDLIVDNHWDQVLVFTRMKHAANRLAEQLITDGLTAAAIHGNKSQSARTKALADFKSHKIQVLVATDIAARGLDIEALPHVINFELPAVAEDYVHRIGRTGRACMPGHAVSIVAQDERDYLKAIEKLLKKKIPTQIARGYDGPVPEDIAEDNKRRDEARANELRKMKEARRRNREKEGAKKPVQKKNSVQVKEKSVSPEKLSDNPNDRFEAKIIRKRPTRTSALTQPKIVKKQSDNKKRVSSHSRSRSR